MKRAPGFTLIELLVVIAIISILAGIMVPRIGPMISRAKAARAAAEIRTIDTALTAILTDTGKRTFGHMWTVPNPADQALFADATQIEWALDIYENAFYLLLRLGKTASSDADWPAQLMLNDKVKGDLGSGYLDIGADPWGNKYQFCPGPLRLPVVPFRSYQIDETIPGAPKDDGFTVSVDTDEDGTDDAVVGWPASRNLAVYVYSKGENLESNQLLPSNTSYDDPDYGLDFVGGGDDISNWDESQSYMTHYK